MRSSSFLVTIVFCFAILMITYGVMTWLHVPVGDFTDWLVGLLSFFWLAAVISIPWNIHFKAKEVLADVGPTRERGLAVDERQVAYVRKLVTWSLAIAIGLHLLSALVLFILGVTGVSRIGYIASVLALLLTGLRPAISAYEYLSTRLRNIGENWKHPQEDVIELRQRVTTLESLIENHRKEFDLERPDSLVSLQRAHVDDTRRELAKVSADIESLRAMNDNEHERLSQEARSAISQLTTDGQFLDHVREIIRFFKTA